MSKTANSAANQKRSAAEQLKVLDDRLGKGKGATKERAKLLKQIQKEKEQASE